MVENGISEILDQIIYGRSDDIIIKCGVKKNKLVGMRSEDSIDKATYESKYADLVVTQENLIENRKKPVETSENEKDIKRRLNRWN